MDNQANQRKLICSKCGATVAPNAKFCTACGTPAPKQVEDQPQNKVFVFCTKCGNKVPSGQQFCTKCGNKITQGTAPANNKVQDAPKLTKEEQDKRTYDQAVRLFGEKRYDQAFQLFVALGEYADSKAKAKECATAIENIRKEQIYLGAISVLKADDASEVDFKKAINALKSIPDYKDSAKKVTEVEKCLDNWYKEKEAEEEAERVRIAKAKAKRKKIFAITIVTVILIAIAVAGVIVGTTKHTITYDLDGGEFVVDEELNQSNPDSYTVLTKDIALINPTKVGYTFIGWTVNDEETPTKDLIIKRWSWGDKNLKANWVPNTYTIILNENGGINIDDVQATYDSAYTLTDPSWPGHTFNGWFLNDQRFSNNGTWNFDENLELTAKWDAIIYDIYYELNGGVNSINNPYTYITDETVIIEAPTRAGYTFLGWTYEGQETPVLELTIPVGTIGDKTYTANWEANTYTITFNTDGGTGVDATQTVTYDSSFTLPTPTRTGYTFNGWYVGETRITSGVWNYSQDYTFKAKWIANTYSVTFDANGGYVDYSSMSATYDSTVTLPTPTRTGYTFVGWYNGNTLVANGTWKHTTDLSLIASWVANTYTLTLNANGGSGSPATMTVTYDQEYTLPTPTRTGYTFDGWYVEDIELTDGIWNYTSNVTLTASWTGNTYGITFDGLQFDTTVTFDYNYDDLSYYTTTLDPGQTLSYPTIPTRYGYVFTGWYTDSDCTTRYTFSGDIVGNFTLYAGWEEQYANSYNNFSLNPSVYNSSNNAYSVYTSSASSSYQNYIYLVANETGEHTIYYRNYESYYYYATYIGITNMTTGERIKSTELCNSTYYDSITFDCNAGDVIVINFYRYDYSTTVYFYFEGFNPITSTAVNNNSTLSVTYGSEITLPSPTKTGYTFEGWYYGDTKIEDGTWSCSDDIQLIPSWTANEYTLTLEANGGTVDSTSLSVTYDSEYTLPTPEKVGYTFNGWYIGSTLIESGTWHYTSDLSLTARWTANTYTLTLNDTVWFLGNIENDIYYPWVIEDGILTSTNQTHSSTSSYTITATSPTTITFSYSVSSESSCDILYILKNGETLVNASGIYTSYVDYSVELGAGETLTFRYRKDGSVSSGSDRAYIANLDVDSNEGMYAEGETTVITVTYDDEITLPISTRNGYTFGGWYNGETLVESGTWNYTEDITLTASWTINSYNLTLDGNGATLDSTSQTITYGDDFTLPTPERTGYTFNGWYSENTLVESGTWNYTSDLALTARWTANQYSITFEDVYKKEDIVVTYDYNYSGTTNYTTLYEGSTLYYPSIPTRSGYVFTGWYTDSACTTKYNFTGTITHDMTLYAGWVEMSMDNVYTENQVNPSFYTSSSSTYTTSTSNTSADYKKHLYLIAEESGTHYIYYRNYYSGSSYRYYLEINNLTKGTTIKSNGSVTSTTYNYVSFECSVGDIIVISLYRDSSSSTAYFYFNGFNAITSTATASVSGFTYNEDDSHTSYVSYDSSFILPTPSKPGYTFAGWYNGETEVESGTWNYTTNITLTPAWTVNDYTIYYDTNGGTLDETSQDVTYGGSFTLPTPTRTGYTFNGWYYKSTKVEDGTWNYATNVRLVASWTANTYYVTYDANGGSVYPSSQNITYGTTITLPTPSKTGYDFAGWYNGDTLVESGVWSYASDIALTASWTGKNYTVTLDPGEGTLDSTSLPVTYGEEFTLPTPERTGYTFDGWYNGYSLIESGTWDYTYDLSLTASWTLTPYTITYTDSQVKNAMIITYDYNYSGATDYPVTIYAGDTIYAPVDPTRSGYVFTGWYTDSECTTKYDFTGTINDDMTLYAGWTDMNIDSTYSETQIIPSAYDSSTWAYGVSTSGTSSSYKKYIYLVAEEEGTHYIYYKNSSSSSNYRYYVDIYNATTGNSIGSRTVSYTYYNYYSFTCSKGDIIVISVYQYGSYSSTASFYFYGFSTPTKTATASTTAVNYVEDSTHTSTVTYGSDVVLATPIRDGYTFDGWYNGDTLVESGTWEYTSDITLTGRWTAN